MKNTKITIFFQITETGRMNLAVKNTFYFIEIKKVFNVKGFSTSSSLLADNNLSLEVSSSLTEEGNSNNNNENNSNSNNNNNNENNLLSPIESENLNNNSSRSSSGDGYETDSNRSYFEEGSFSMAECNVRDIPEDYLRRYIKDTDDMTLHPEKYGLNSEENSEFVDEWVDRNQELRDELRRRKDEGLIPDSSSESAKSYSSIDSNDSQDNNLNIPDNSTAFTGGEGDLVEGNLVEGNATDTGTFSGIESIAGIADNDNGSSSINKRKLAEDEDSTTQPSKRFKQDSSDITGDTEPYDFTGGEDS
jgi:hypothetical protein